MSLLGIDVGTSGCKVSVFNSEGRATASAYVEYDIQRPNPGWTELDARDNWEKIKRAIAEAASKADPKDPIRSLAVSSRGEATVPVTADREILGPSLLNSDSRGEEYLEHLATVMPNDWLYGVNGNVLGNQYSLTKLMWIRQHRAEVYDKAYKFLHWSPFVSFMLGADAVVDYSLANRTLLFDIDAKTWSDEALKRSNLDRAKLPDTAPSGTKVGTVSDDVAEELGLPKGVSISTGAHDQCANAVGCGVTREDTAMYGMGSVICIVPVFRARKEPALMIPRGLNTEHHAVPNRFVSFIYNQGGCLVKWFRDTFAAVERRQADDAGRDVYDALFSEIPSGPSEVIVLPHFDSTGPPQFVSDSAGVMAGLKLHTSRGDILKGILEGATYYLRQIVDELPATGTTIE
ncbi:MAG: FGGY-family carbohydrate kinase, partial [Planctomycetia bacterium]|nr:FGGY-family carbohydrate kinase [Planctomycetia bacterium]